MRLLLAEVLAIDSQRTDDFPFADRQPDLVGRGGKPGGKFRYAAGDLAFKKNAKIMMTGVILPVHLGYPADHPRLVAGHQRNLRSRIRERAIPTLRQRPGIGRQSSGDSVLLRLIQMV